MTQYIVEMRQVSTAYATVDADSLEDAKTRAYRREGLIESSFIESTEIVAAWEDDTRFDEDDTELIDDYEIEQEDTDE